MKEIKKEILNNQEEEQPPVDHLSTVKKDEIRLGKDETISTTINYENSMGQKIHELFTEALQKGILDEIVERRRKLLRERQARYRANQNPEMAAKRKQKDAERHAQRRSEETWLEKNERRQKDRERAVKRIKNESTEQTTRRKQMDRLRHAIKRSLETPEQKEKRRKIDAERKRYLRMKLQEAICFNVEVQLEDDAASNVPNEANLSYSI